MMYLILKAIHIFAIMLFLGNITTGLFWMHYAVRTKSQEVINHTIKSIIQADKIFTIPGVIVIVASGIGLALYAHFPMLKTSWILWPILLFITSGIAFGLKVTPLQNRIYTLTSTSKTMANEDWYLFRKLLKNWDVWGLVALLTPFIAFGMMVLKVPV
jgi:uncharacterized membrane protein